MSTLVKITLFAVVGLMVAVLFVPNVRQVFSQLLTTSETITLPGTVGAGNSGLDGQQVELVTLLGFDGIPAILDPEFVSAEEAERWMDPDEQVLGLSINGESRAYSVRMLSRHEIVNDVVGGEAVVVTW